MNWSAVYYCDVFISCLDSHSDGTHSLQSIHWWASDVMLHFSKSAKKKTHTHLRWPESEYIFSIFFLWTITLKNMNLQAMKPGKRLLAKSGQKRVIVQEVLKLTPNICRKSGSRKRKGMLEMCNRLGCCFSVDSECGTCWETSVCVTSSVCPSKTKKKKPSTHECLQVKLTTKEKRIRKTRWRIVS